MKKLYAFKGLFLVLMVLGLGSRGWGQTNPTPFALSGGNFSFTSQTATNTTYPTNIQGWTTGTNNLAAITTAAPASDQALVASGTASTSGLSNLGASGFNFLSTSSSPNQQVGEIAVALNTTNRTNILVSWLAADQTSGSTRQMNITLQYRVGTTGTFTTVAGSTYTTSNTLQASATTFTNIALPSACDNQAVVQIRWITYESANQSNGRDAVRLDDITVSSSANGSPTLIPSPSALTGLTYIVGSGPSTASSFTVTGSNLSPASGNITISSSKDYEVSTSSSTTGFGSSAVLGYTGSALNSSNTVWVRLKTGLAAGTYNSETISISGGGATASVTASGSVTLVNDECANATPLTAEVTATGTLTGATPTSGSTSNDVYYAFTPSVTGAYRITINNFSASGDKDIYVYSTCNATFSSTTNLVASGTSTSATSETAIASSLTAGTSYKILVQDYGSSGGTFDIVVQALAAAPTTPANSVAVNAATRTASTLDVSWTNGNGAGRIVVARLTATARVAPTPGTTYTPSASGSFAGTTTTGTGNVVIYNGTGSSVGVTNLSTNNAYTFDVYDYNGSGTSTNYSAVASGSGYTLAIEPVTQASSVTFSSVTTTGFTIGFTAGSGTNRLVVVKAGSAVDAVPTDGTAYSASTTFGSGTPITTGNYVVYSGTGSSVTVSGLASNTTYYVAVYEFSGSSTGTTYNYLVTSPAIGNQVTLVAAPTTAASSVTVNAATRTTSTLDVSWTNGNGAGRIVIARLTATSRVAPLAGTSYTPSTPGSFTGTTTTGSGNVVIYNGTGSSVAVTNLSLNSAYTFDVYEYNGSGSTTAYSSVASSSSTFTLATQPSVQASAVNFTAVSQTGFTIGWASGNGTNRLVLVKAGSPVDASPVTGTGYTANTAFGSGTQIGTGNYVVYNSTGSSVSVTGLTAATMYYVAVYDFNGSSTSANYLTVSPATGSQATQNDYIPVATLGSTVTENLDGMGTGTTLPTGFKINSDGAIASWTTAVNSVTITQTSGSPSTGGTYNIGTTSSISDRAVGALTSGGFNSPNNLLAKFRNTTGSTINTLTVGFDLERYRINSSAASLSFFYSLNGTTWVAVSAADIAAASLPTGTAANYFPPSGTPSSTNGGVISKSGISITGLTLSNNSDIYLQWSLNTTGSNSQLIAIDNVSVYACRALTASITGNNGPVCSGGNATFNLTGSSGATVTYNINSGSNQTIVLTGGAATVTVPGVSSNQTMNLISVFEGNCSTVLSGSSTVTVNSTPTTPTLTITQPCPSGTGTITVTAPTGAGYSYSLNGGTYQAGTDFTGLAAGTYSVTAQNSNGCISSPTSATVNTPANYWTGNTSSDWSDASNWSCGSVPASTDDAVIPITTNKPVLSVNSAIGGLTIQAGAGIALNGHNFGITGTVSGTGVLTGSAASSLLILGSGSGTIYFDQSGDSLTNIVSQLGVSRSSGSITLGNKLYITDVLTSTAGILNTGGFLVLRSTDTAATARVAPVGGTISGNVVIERYFTGTRSYRLISPPVASSQSYQASWMEGQKNNAPAYSQQNNSKPGYGTQISGTGGAANGFDETSTNASSLFTYDNIAQTYSAATNATTTGVLKPGKGYRLFVRGSRAIDLSSNNPPSSSTILRVTGTLNTGDFSFPTPDVPLSSAVAGYSFVGNPYASPVSWKLVNRTNVASTYFAYDPLINARGAFVSYNSFNGQNNNASSQVNDTLQSGEAFFVQSNGSGAALTFTEVSKTIGNASIFRTLNTAAVLSVKLLLNTDAGSQNTADGVRALFDDAYSCDISDEDSYKLTNIDENIAIRHDATDLSIEAKPKITAADTIHLKMWQLRKKSYYLQLDCGNFEAGMTAFVRDAYLHSETPVNVTDSTLVPFSITTDSASFAQDRFSIILKPSATLPVTITNVSAVAEGKGIRVNWLSQAELNIDHYEIEKSVNGQQFEKVTVIKAKGDNGVTGSYNWFDESPVIGANYYRIKVIEKSGTVAYTQIVRVAIDKAGSSMAVYPNPVKSNTISLHLVNMDKGRYTVTLYNNLGQKMYTSTIDHNGASAVYALKPGKVISKGTYRLHAAKGEKIMNTMVVFE